jgi:hypothetical protein
MASLTTDEIKDPKIQRIWSDQDRHAEAARAARVPLKKNIGVRRGSPTPTEGDGTKEPDIKRHIASPTMDNPGRMLNVSSLPDTPIKPEQEKPAPRSKVANKNLFDDAPLPRLPERKPSFEALDSSMLGSDVLPPLTRDDETWVEQTFPLEDRMDYITDWEPGTMSLFETLTTEELNANEIMNRMDSGDLSQEEGEKMLEEIVRDLKLTGRQASLQSDFLSHYLDKPCKRSTTIKLKKPAAQLTNHINIKF